MTAREHSSSSCCRHWLTVTVVGVLALWVRAYLHGAVAGRICVGAPLRCYRRQLAMAAAAARVLAASLPAAYECGGPPGLGPGRICAEVFQSSLENDIKGDTSGTIKRLFVSLATGHRDETEKTDQELAYKDAQTLLRAGELFHGTDESTFNQILCQRNRSQLRLIFDEYEKLTGHNFETAVDNEFSGTAKDTILDLVKCIKNKIDYLAEQLHKSMEGMGTDDRTLIRIVVSRSEKDLGEIKEAFEKKYGKSLADFIEDDTSGDYKKALLSVIG